ncbi:MAG: radical SAM protein [bacterium]|nr:radical SAM protein [bacterium]
MNIIFPVCGAENISVSYLSTVLKQAGHQVRVAFDRMLFDDKQYFTVPFLNRLLSETEAMIQAIITAKPDVLAMSCFVDNYQWCLDVVRRVRAEHPCITVWGGMHPTTCPEEVIRQPEVDYMIVGEGEAPLIELIESLQKSTSPDAIPNLWLCRGNDIVRNRPRPLMRPEEFPKVDKTLYEPFVPIRDYYMTVTSKGCIARCSYCSQNALHDWEKSEDLGPFLREKPVEAVLQELSEMKQRYRIRYVDIKNNVLSGNHKWLTEFLERYPREIGLPFRIMGHPLMFQSDLAQRLKAAGCHHIQLGIESLNPKVREEVLLRNESNAQIRTALDTIEAAGINFSADFIFGLPGESETDLIDALKLMAGYKRLIRASIFWLQYLPGVAITKIAGKKGYIDDINLCRINEGRQNNYLSTGSPMEPQRERLLKTYHIMFRLLPILPAAVMRRLLEWNLHRLFRLIPLQVVLIILIDVFVSFVRRDHYAKWIMGWYVRQVCRHLFNKHTLLAKTS